MIDFTNKGRRYAQGTNMSLEQAKKACRQAFNKAVKFGEDRETLEAQFDNGFNEVR